MKQTYRNLGAHTSNETATFAANRQIRQINQSVRLTYMPFNQTFLDISGHHQYMSQPQQADIAYFFVDANIRHHLTDWRTDLELNLTNLANVTSYGDLLVVRQPIQLCPLPLTWTDGHFESNL